LEEALNWTREQKLSVTDDLSYLREYEHITLARALLARATAERDRATATLASDLIGRLLDAADAGGRGGSVVELLILRALACRATGDRDAASATLDRALALAEPEGYVRAFLDEGPPMAELLAETARRAPASYANRVLGAVGERVATPARRQPLVEPLSERELEVLRLLASDLDGPEIAAHLFVSVNTLRTHTRNIFAKLGVNSRRAAVTRAAELRLLARDG
jgi:LuxR family maltose regulon positive regulatory protein